MFLPRRCAAVGVVATLTFAGASASAAGAGGRLSASTGGGGFIAAAPVRHPYWVSEGDWVLCDTARDSGTPTDTITITGVRYVIGRHEPLAARVYLRTVSPRRVANHPKKPDGAYSPFGSRVGRPPRFVQSYADSRNLAPGHYTRAIAGTRVVHGCDQTSDDASADTRGDVPRYAWISLVLAVEVGRFAGRVRRTLVDYSVGGMTHTLRIRWELGGRGYRTHP